MVDAATATTAPPTRTTAAAKTTTTRRATTTKPAKASKTVTLLVVAPSSGPHLESGTAAVRAVKLAITHATEDRLLPSGWGVEVETIDEAANSGPAPAVGRTLKKNADIVAVIGALDPVTAGPLGAATAAQSTTLFLLSPDATRAEPAAAGTTPAVTLRLLTDDTTTGTYAGNYALSGPVLAAAGSKVATASDSPASARAFAAAVTARLASSGAAVASLGLAATDHEVLTPAFVTKVFDTAPRLIAFGGAVETGVPLSAAARRAQPVATFLVGGQVGVSGCADALSALGEGDLCAVGATPLSNAERARAFREDYAAAGHGAPTVSVTAAYDAATMVLRVLPAVIRSLGDDPDPDALRAPLMTALRTTRLDGATGTSRFDAAGNRVTPSISVLRKQAGRWVVAVATT